MPRPTAGWAFRCSIDRRPHSVMSAVGLLPGSAASLDTVRLLAGAAEMDAHTRESERDQNAAMQLALMWFYAGAAGEKDMVILPYKDRLALSEILQQLVMESLGKRKRTSTARWFTRHRGYGNKARPTSMPM